MVIIARANPGDIRNIGSLPGVRNTTRVSSAPTEGLADAVSGLAAQGLKVYEQHQQRNDLAAVMQARRELSDWEGATFDPGNKDGIAQFQGGRALEANEKLIPDLDSRLSEIGARLTPSQRAQFDQVATSFRDSVQGRLNTFMTGEHEKFLRADRIASVSNVVNDANRIAVDGDMDTAKARLSEALTMQRMADESDGASANVITFNQRSMMSGFLASVTESYLATDALKAQEFVSRYGDDLLPEDRARVDRALGPLLKDARASSLAGAAIQGGEFPDFTSYSGKSDGRAAPKVPAQVRGIIETAADKYGVPRNIALALAQKESGFNPKAVNPEALDDGDHATGLFQYRKTTADALGIDRTDANQSADAAMKQMAEQAKAKGWDWAIAHHFAGPDEKQHGPRTRAYVEDVRAKARRFGGVEAPGTVYHEAPAASMADALERVRREPDPFLRDEAERKVRQHFDLVKTRQQEADKQTETSIGMAIEEADPGLSPRQALTPQQFAYAESTGMLGTIERRLDQRLKGTMVQDDARLVERLGYSALANPSAFKKVNLLQYSADLSPDTLARFKKMQGDATKPGKQDEWATESQLLSLANQDMGITGDKQAEKRVKFQSAYYTQKRTFMERNGGKEPTADEAQKIINQLKLPFVKQGFLGFGGGQRRAFEGPAEGYDIPTESRAQIVAALKDAGVANPTEEQVRRTYFTSAGSNL